MQARSLTVDKTKSLPEEVKKAWDSASSKSWTDSETERQASLSRPLILYAYSETDNARRNLQFFIDHGLHANADFVFILNGETTANWLLPNRTNIRYVQRENDCFDLGAYAEVLTTNGLYKKYQRFILMNASIRGPFLPYWAESCWSDRYLSQLSDTVKVSEFFYLLFYIFKVSRFIGT